MNCPAKGCRAIHIQEKWTHRSEDPTESNGEEHDFTQYE